MDSLTAARAKLRLADVRQVALTAGGAVLAAGANGLKVCDADLKVQQTLHGPGPSFGYGLATSASDESALCTDGSIIYIYDIERGRLDGDRGLRSDLTALAWSPRDEFALAACGEGLLRVDLREDQVAWLERDRQYHAVTFAPDGRVAAAGGRGFVELWRMNVQAARGARLVGHEGYVKSVAICPKSKLLVSGGEDGTVRLWDLKSRKETACLEGHEGAVTGVALNPHVQRAVSVGEDGTLRLWDIPSRDQLLCLEAHGGGATSVAWFGDGMHAVTGGADGVRTWRLPGVDEPLAGELPTYSPRATFEVGARLGHPIFGAGTVTAVIGKTIQVAFAKETKRLAHGR